MIVSHEVGLDEAPSAYKRFDEREIGKRKLRFATGAPQDGPADPARPVLSLFRF